MGVQLYIFLALAWCPLSVLAYDDSTTHPALTDAIVDYYNTVAPPSERISPEEKEWIVQGSMLEDAAPRWVNHFYDPVHGEGWLGENAGQVPDSAIRLLSNIGLSTEPPRSAVEWATDWFTQEKYRFYGGNRTWKKGLEHYSIGDKKEAYVTLGHIIHLLEDMGVPDHTRNDTHAHIPGDEGSPYEDYARKWNRSTIKSLPLPSATPPSRSTLEDYLVEMAKYSNRYFFSKDTINSAKFSEPKLSRQTEDLGYGLDEIGAEFPLVMIEQKINGFELVQKLSLEKLSSYDPIFDAYFSRLSRQIILNGGGLVRLFKKQAEEQKVNNEFTLYRRNEDFGRWFVLPNISLYGAAQNFANSAMAWTASAMGAAGRLVATAMNALQSDDRIATETGDSIPEPPELGTPFVAGPPRLIGISAPSEPLSLRLLEYSTEDSEAFVGTSSTSPVPTTSTISSSSEPVINTGGPPPSIVPARPSGLLATFDKDLLQISLTWNSDPSLSAPLYQISRTDSGDVLAQTTSTSFAERIYEIGRSYSYEVSASDGGQAVGSNTVSVSPAGFLDRVHFYLDTRTNGSGNYVIDMFYATSTFAPSPLSGGMDWHAIVFYLNNPAHPDNRILNAGNFFRPSTGTVVGVRYNICASGSSMESAFVYSFDATHCGTGGGLKSMSGLLPTEDNHIFFVTNIPTSTALTSADYLTLSFYDFLTSGGTSHELVAVATDTTRYYFQAAPPAQSTPSRPVLATPVFDSSQSRLAVGSQALGDPDSPDSQIVYEFNYSTSSELDVNAWSSGAANFPVVFGNTYLYGIRAKDDFGNVSETVTSTWSFPDGYAPLPSSLGKTHGIALPDGANGQKILVQATTTISGLYSWLVNPGGSCCATMYFDIREDAGGAPGPALASSSVNGLPLNTSSAETLFSFAPIALSANTSYWFVPVPMGSNPPVVMGAADNYANGRWSGDASLDMYFRLQN